MCVIYAYIPMSAPGANIPNPAPGAGIIETVFSRSRFGASRRQFGCLSRVPEHVMARNPLFFMFSR